MKDMQHQILYQRDYRDRLCKGPPDDVYVTQQDIEKAKKICTNLNDNSMETLLIEMCKSYSVEVWEAIRTLESTSDKILKRMGYKG